MALSLLGAAACSDDGTDASIGEDGDRAASSGDAGSAGSGSGSDSDSDKAGLDGIGVDTCELLEASEIDAHFGDRGEIGDPHLNGTVCSWEVTDVSGQVVGGFGLALMGLQPGQSLAEMVTADGVIDVDSLVPVDGVGDEAYFEGFSLYFRSGETPFAMMPALPGADGDPQERDALVALADVVISRL